MRSRCRDGGRARDRQRPGTDGRALIVGERLVWAHLPKTGGDATAAMFAAVDRLVVEADDRRSHRKHQTIEARVGEGLDLAGRATMCNIRRLPGWVLSSARHQHRHYGLEPDWGDLRRGVVASRAPLAIHRFVPGPFRAPLYRGLGRVERVTADEVLARHTAVPIDHWLRQEHLVDDFVDVVGRIAGLTPDEEAAVRRVRAVNRHDGYDHDVTAVFSGDDLVSLYERNPAWAALERRCYGATMAG